MTHKNIPLVVLFCIILYQAKKLFIVSAYISLKSCENNYIGIGGEILNSNTLL